MSDLNFVNDEELDDLPEIYNALINEIGMEDTIKVAKLFSGERIYFHKIESIERPLRNKKIRDAFNGYNYKELAKKYNLTETMIRNICNNLINKIRNAPCSGQLSLFENKNDKVL